ncbi:hypothetical protein HDE_00723 [Halotydeus destructor]|nr:hypothetical protein HDE_00723 [Halotydeus destructor]
MASDGPKRDRSKSPPRSANARKIALAPGEKAGECTICLQAISERAVLDPCHHEFDVHCLDTWSERHNTCPNCREVYSRILFNIRAETEFDAKTVEAPPAEPTIPIHAFGFQLSDDATIFMLIPLPGFFLVASNHPVDLITQGPNQESTTVTVQPDSPMRLEQLTNNMSIRDADNTTHSLVPLLPVMAEIRQQAMQTFMIRMMLQRLAGEAGQQPLAIEGPPGATTPPGLQRAHGGQDTTAPSTAVGTRDHGATPGPNALALLAALLALNQSNNNTQSSEAVPHSSLAEPASEHDHSHDHGLSDEAHREVGLALLQALLSRQQEMREHTEATAGSSPHTPMALPPASTTDRIVSGRSIAASATTTGSRTRSMRTTRSVARPRVDPLPSSSASTEEDASSDRRATTGRVYKRPASKEDDESDKKKKKK